MGWVIRWGKGFQNPSGGGVIILEEFGGKLLGKKGEGFHESGNKNNIKGFH